MRVAHIITRMILGGAQENTLLCCEDLMRRHGDEVLLVTGPAIGPEGSLLERARAGGVPVELVPALRRAIHPWYDPAAYAALRRAIRRFQPDVVHTHSAKAGILGRAAAWSLGVPAIVHTVHGAPFHREQSRPARWCIAACERWAARRCHALVSVADAMTDLVVASGIAPRERCTTIRSGFEVAPFLECARWRAEVRARFGYAAEHVVVGKIARLARLKGHDDLIRAAEKIVALRPDVRFLLVGDGSERARLERRIASAGLGRWFHLIGLVAPEEIPRYLAAMDLLVHVSLREGLARALPQALVAGVPVVSYDLDGAREVVLPGVTGRLVEPRRIDQLVDAVVALASDEPLRRQLGAEGRRRFADVFRHEHMTEAIRALYVDLLRRARQVT